MKEEMYILFLKGSDGASEVLGLKAGTGLSGTVAHWLLTYQATAPPLAFRLARHPLKAVLSS